ncbi:MAG: DUF2726 domain-containing protein [Planctomycetes bacterium]|nr:DUF2726 domain-containing protein [Planctomycetota bacterium]
MASLLDYWPLAAFAALALLFLSLARRSPPAPPLEKRGSLLSPVQQQFYHALTAAVGDRFAVCPMVRLADVLQVRGEPQDRGAWQRRIDSRRVEFLLCDPQSLAPRVCVVLTERAEPPAEPQDRDTFLEDASAAAGLPLVRVPTAKVYEARRLSEAIDAALG